MLKMLNVSVASELPVGKITCVGEVDAFTDTKLRESVHQLMEEGCSRLVFDMSQVTYMDSTGVKVLIEAYKQLNTRGGCVELVGCNDTLLRIFEVTRLKSYFLIHEGR